MHVPPCALCGGPIEGLCHRDNRRKCTHWECRFAASIPLDTLRDADGYYDPSLVATKLASHVNAGDHQLFPTAVQWCQFLSVYQKTLCSHGDDASCCEPCCSLGLWHLLEEERRTLVIYEKRAQRFRQLRTLDRMERFYNHISQLSPWGGIRFSILDAARQNDCLEKRWALCMIAKLQHAWAAQNPTQREKEQWLRDSRWNQVPRARAVFDKVIRCIVSS